MSDTYYIPDVTGIDPRYKVSNDIYTVTRTGMIIDFGTPIFYDTLKIVSSSDGQVWVDPNNYTISQRDDTAESRAMNLDSHFNYRLVRSITVNTQVSTPFQISATYQRFYPTTPIDPISSQDGVLNLTPGLIKNILNRLQSVENKSLMVSAASMPSDANFKVLTYDIDGTNPDNVITDETYSVNTFNGQNIIFPVQGSFFRDSVSIKVSGNHLVADKDFIVADFDQYKTRDSANKSGIYNCIVILADYAGDDLQVTYHAVGGTPTTTDLIRLQSAQKDVITFLKGTQYLTADMLNTNPLISSLANRISLMEKNMRAFAQTPTYGNTTSGTTVTRALKTNDTQLHWWSIASLYTVDNGTEIFTADTFKAHIEMPDRHLQADVTISVDILNATQPLRISSANVFYDQGYTVNGPTSTSQTPPPILFRIIYNQTADNSSGVYLQIGTSLPSLTERFGITDNSGVESAWLLALPASSEAALPNDTTVITMPNSSRVWSPTGDQSKSAVVTLPLSEGYLVSSGAVDLSQISSPNVSSSSPFSLGSVLQSWQPITQVTGFRVYYTFKDSNNVTHPGVMTLPAVYDKTSGKAVASTAIDDLGYGASSNGSLRLSLDSKNTYLYFTGTAPSSGTVLINYIIADISGQCTAQ